MRPTLRRAFITHRSVALRVELMTQCRSLTPALPCRRRRICAIRRLSSGFCRTAAGGAAVFSSALCAMAARNACLASNLSAPGIRFIRLLSRLPDLNFQYKPFLEPFQAFWFDIEHNYHYEEYFFNEIKGLIRCRT